MDKKPTREELLIEAMNVLEDLAVSAQIVSANNKYAHYNTHGKCDLQMGTDQWESLRVDLAKAFTLVRDHTHRTVKDAPSHPKESEVEIQVGEDYCHTQYYSNVILTMITQWADGGLRVRRSFICPADFDNLIDRLCEGGSCEITTPNSKEALTALGLIADDSSGGVRGTRLLKVYAEELIGIWKKRQDSILSNGGVPR